jgi:hypothetical protein
MLENVRKLGWNMWGNAKFYMINNCLHWVELEFSYFYSTGLHDEDGLNLWMICMWIKWESQGLSEVTT